MDKYDILFCLDGIKNFINSLKKRNNFYKKYLRRKKEFMMMEYYKLRTKRSVEYNDKKGGSFLRKGVEKVLDFDLSKRYAWEMFKKVEKEEL
jgi:hypothetical protein